MAGRGIERRVHRNGVVEFDDPDTGRHVMLIEGMRVESGENDALAIVSVAAIVSCSACLKRWLMPIADYRPGWNTCRHCSTQLYLPTLFAEGGPKGSLALLPLRGHDFSEPDEE